MAHHVGGLYTNDKGVLMQDEEGTAKSPPMRRRKQRSMDELLQRNATYGAGLNELDDILNDDTTQAIAEQQRAIKTPVQTSPISRADGAANGAAAKYVGMAAGAALIGFLAMRPDWFSAKCVAILASLVSFAVLAVGVENVKQIGRVALATPPSAVLAWPPRIPLTDSVFDIGTANKFANSCQVREKGLKILQYVLRGAAYSAALPKPVGAHLKDLSKKVRRPAKPVF
jgi:hypothetical protein